MSEQHREPEQDPAGQDPAGQEPADQEPADQEPAASQDGEPWFDENWTRVHPLSPFVRGWLTVAAVPVVVFGYNWEMWRDLWEIWRSGELMASVERNPMPYVFGSGGALLLIVLIFVGFLLSWWFTRYQVTADHVMVKSGIFVRQHRQARIDRVQAVDLRQPLLARITGLAELKFEVAEGDGTAATLAFLKRSEAEELRAEIMDRASGREEFSQRAGTSAAEDPAAETSEAPVLDAGPAPLEPSSAEDGGDSHSSPEQHSVVHPSAVHPSPEQHHSADRQIARVPTGRLIGSVLTGFGTLLLLLVVVLSVSAGAIALVVSAGGVDDALTELREDFSVGELIGVAPTLLPALVGLIAVYYQGFSKGYGFTATMTDAGLRLKYGLLETTTQTVPPGRVQAIQIQQPLLWRPFGWFKMVVSVAGYGTAGQRNTLLPVGRFEDVMAVTAEMFPDLQVEHPEALFREGVMGRGTRGGFTEVPRRAWIFDPLVRRRRGFSATPTALMVRDGVTLRLLSMVPHERIQSLGVAQGPLKRLFRLANLRVHLPGGPILAITSNQDLEATKELFEKQSAYAATARRYSDRNRWMLPEELREFEKKVEEAVDAGHA